MSVLSGAQLAGGNPVNPRVDHDFYATDPKAVYMLLNSYHIKGNTVLEPCVGAGHIANAIENYYFLEKDDLTVTGIDIVDRGYKNTIISDFLLYETDKKYDCIITNPPYSLAQEFIEKGMNLLADSGQMIMFLKLQFLEGIKRREFFEKYPPKYIYVFRNRMATWNNGNEVDPKNGKKWSTTMCHAWFIWEKNSNTEPLIRWL